MAARRELSFFLAYGLPYFQAAIPSMAYRFFRIIFMPGGFPYGAGIKPAGSREPFVSVHFLFAAWALAREIRPSTYLDMLLV